MTDAEHFKAWLKDTKRTYRDVALSTGRSASWIGDIARGNYPWYQGGKLPKYLWDWAIGFGMPCKPDDPTLVDQSHIAEYEATLLDQRNREQELKP